MNHQLSLVNMLFSAHRAYTDILCKYLKTDLLYLISNVCRIKNRFDLLANLLNLVNYTEHGYKIRLIYLDQPSDVSIVCRLICMICY